MKVAAEIDPTIGAELGGKSSEERGVYRNPRKAIHVPREFGPSPERFGNEVDWITTARAG